MKKILMAIAGALFLTSVIFNVLLFTSTRTLTQRNTNILSEIQGKSGSTEEYIKNLEDRIKTYEEKITDIESVNEKNTQDNEETANKIMCLELVKKTPQSGDARYIGIDIVGYYNKALDRYNEVKGGKYQREDDPEDNKAELESVTKWYNEAKPLYEEYARKCL